MIYLNIKLQNNVTYGNIYQNIKIFILNLHLIFIKIININFYIIKFILNSKQSYKRYNEDLDENINSTLAKITEILRIEL